eukprot:TRINITY_DN11647_c2_g4_i1.p1 TRINITY_DN11647_c2_g4~~TRINITY_DN11647_c2_g4_i1.p1  ORF type:complete len:105 (-),score=1.56 TRINITY_DN11647_c2_g4_i1:41-325(-)
MLIIFVGLLMLTLLVHDTTGACSAECIKKGEPVERLLHTYTKEVSNNGTSRNLEIFYLSILLGAAVMVFCLAMMICQWKGNTPWPPAQGNNLIV